MKRYKIPISQNGWEYTGYAWIECDDIKKISDNSALIDNKYTLKFDEEIGTILVSDKSDDEYNFKGYVFK
ncbi:TPA: hypothetical protein LA460_000136 [Clostridium botulinum]|nr:hypothetical protein [Clostridium botulinum]HBJ1652741.1 hypothetical protein [Clostridium botulinum]